MRPLRTLPLLLLPGALLAQSAPALPAPEPTAPVGSKSIPADPSTFAWPDTPAGKLMRDGIRLHDAGDYPRAIGKYRRALELDPGDGKTIRYEIANSLHTSGDPKGAMEELQTALAVPGADFPELFVMLGNLYDGEGRADEAIHAYRRGLDQWPDYFNLHFNLGITLVARNRYPEARAEFQRAVRANPAHASSHFNLGMLYASTGYPVPALMAFGRFLELEPAGDRARTALSVVDDLLKRGVEENPAEPDSPRIANYTGMPDEEGSQEKLYTVLRLLAARLRNIGGRGKSTLPEFLGMLLEATGDDRIYPGVQPGFALNYYLPYYREMNHRGDAHAYTNFVFASSGAQNLGKLGAAERGKVVNFRDWTLGFAWNSAAPIREPGEAAPSAGAPRAAPTDGPSSAPAPQPPPASAPHPAAPPNPDAAKPG